MAVEDFTDFTITDAFVTLSDPRLPAEHLDLLVNSRDDFVSSGRVVARNVLVDLLETVRGFGRPDYFRHDSILDRISASVIVRPASESANPRWTMRA